MMRDECLTHRQFEYLMAELGYSPVQVAEPTGRFWQNEDFDALKYLPKASPDELVPRHHLITLRKVSVEKGMVEEEEFERLLKMAQQSEVMPAISHAAA